MSWGKRPSQGAAGGAHGKERRGGCGERSHSGRDRGGRGRGGRSGNYQGWGDGAFHVLAFPPPDPIAVPVATTNSFLHQQLSPQIHAVLQATALPATPAAAGLTGEGAIEGSSPAASSVAPAKVDDIFDGLEEMLDNKTQAILKARIALTTRGNYFSVIIRLFCYLQDNDELYPGVLIPALTADLPEADS